MRCDVILEFDIVEIGWREKEVCHNISLILIKSALSFFKNEAGNNVNYTNITQIYCIKIISDISKN